MMDNPTDFYDALAPMFDVMTDWDGAAGGGRTVPEVRA